MINYRLLLRGYFLIETFAQNKGFGKTHNSRNYYSNKFLPLQNFLKQHVSNTYIFLFLYIFKFILIKIC